MNYEVIKECIQKELYAIGEYPTREGLLGTPDRVARMYQEVFGGYYDDALEVIKSATFEKEDSDEMIIVRDIQFYSHCEHHMVPFFGKAHVGYIPNKKIVGLSKLARVVDIYSRRLQIQERLTREVGLAIEELNPLGVMVVIEAEHLCMKMRGIKNPCADTVTSYCSGVFRDNSNNARAEFLQLIRRNS